VRPEVERYLITEQLPLFWCPGCGNGVVLGAVLRAFAALDLDPRQVVVVTGIGCFGKADDYIKTNAIHGTHGRALAIATGVKAANPELTVVALMGDGDCATIGGNHLIHAARRNIGVTAVVANNFNYGMTGGQYSATTALGDRTSTSPYGNPEGDFDLCRLTMAAGAGFVARTTVYHVRQLAKLVIQALSHPGFALVEAASSCPVHYGRHHGRLGPTDMMRHWRERAIPLERYRGLPFAERRDALAVGVFVDQDRPDFSARYAAVQQAARQRGLEDNAAASRR